MAETAWVSRYLSKYFLTESIYHHSPILCQEGSKYSDIRHLTRRINAACKL